MDIVTRQLYKNIYFLGIHFKCYKFIPNVQARGKGGKEKLPEATGMKTWGIRLKRELLLIWLMPDSAIKNYLSSITVCYSQKLLTMSTRTYEYEHQSHFYFHYSFNLVFFIKLKLLPVQWWWFECRLFLAFAVLRLCKEEHPQIFLGGFYVVPSTVTSWWNLGCSSNIPVSPRSSRAVPFT